jgi:hypothetical protein
LGTVREVWYFFCFSFYSVLISGISQVVLQHNIDLYPHSIEPIKTSTFQHISTIIRHCFDKFVNKQRLTNADIEEIACMVVVRLYNMAESLVQMILLPPSKTC